MECPDCKSSVCYECGHCGCEDLPKKVYILFVQTKTYTEILGVYDSLDKAKESLEKTRKISSAFYEFSPVIIEKELL